MEYDLEVVVPACKKYESRFGDFKKYGLLNIGDKKIKVNVILSGAEEISNLEEGWPEGTKVNIVRYSSSQFIKNIYRFFLEYNLNSKSRWIIKLDDDSCTDVSGLIDNLDQFYDCNEPYYLASSCVSFEECMGPEYWCLEKYIETMEEYKKIVFLLYHEIECSIISRKGLNKILQNNKSVDLLNKRCNGKIEGGATDIVLAFASALAKLYPIDCPFLTHFPQIEKFSILGGFKNHIHLISRDQKGENFNSDNRADCFFKILTKVVDNTFSEIEKKIKNNTIEIEIDDQKMKYELKNNCLLRLKSKQKSNPDFSMCYTRDSNPYDPLFWFEENEIINIVGRERIIKKINFKKIFKKTF